MSKNKVGKPEDFFFLQGLSEKYLRDLNRAVKLEMKRRGIVKYDLRSESFVPSSRPVKRRPVKKIKQKISKGLIVKNRNNRNCGDYGARHKGLCDNSILIDFLKEDWRHLFSSDFDETPKYYVYYHFNPETEKLCFMQGGDELKIRVHFSGKPFYVGKGTGSRHTSMKSRSRSHLNRIKNILELGYAMDNVSHILQDGLTELEALELESKLISFFGCSAELPRNKVHFCGVAGGCLINSDVGARPEWIEDLMHQTIKAKKRRSLKNPDTNKIRNWR